MRGRRAATISDQKGPPSLGPKGATQLSSAVDRATHRVCLIRADSREMTIRPNWILTGRMLGGTFHGAFGNWAEPPLWRWHLRGLECLGRP